MWGYLFISAVIIILVAWRIAVFASERALEGYGFQRPKTQDDDDETSKNGQFVETYCLKDTVYEAFQVGAPVIPQWALNESMDIIVSLPPRVVLHDPSGEDVTVLAGDYVVRNSKGGIGCISKAELEKHFVKVAIAETR